MPEERTSTTPESEGREPGLGGLRVIAVIKIAKGLLLTGLSFGIFRSINRDLGEMVHRITFNLRIDPENHFVRLILEKLGSMDHRMLRTVGWITLFYAAMLYVEGVGLWLGQAWAEYLLLVATGLFIPEEAYACLSKFDRWRLGLLAANIAAFLFVAWAVWAQRRRMKGR